MQRTMDVFVIPPDRLPGGPPDPARKMVVDAATIDGALDAARALLVAEGYRVRSVSIGPRSLVAYVEAAR